MKSSASAADYAEFQPLLHDLAEAAAAVTLPYFRSALAVENKASEALFDPVTAADRDAEQAIRDVLRHRRPDDSIEGEELGTHRGTSGYRWIIDPIDGTRSFLTGTPLWGTVIGLYKDGKPFAGMFSQPFTGERFWACGDTARFARIQSRPAAQDQLPLGEPLATRSSPLGDAILMTTDQANYRPEERLHYDALARGVRLKRYSADAYAFAMLAAGQVQLVAEPDLNTYDIAGMIPIIEAAGGVITDWSGDPVHAGGTALASADQELHDKALSVLNSPSG